MKTTRFSTILFSTFLLAVSFLLQSCDSEPQLPESGSISPKNIQQQKQDGDILIDVRETDEFEIKHIPGAKSVPLTSNEWTELLNQHSTDEPLYVYSNSGSRSEKARKQAVKAGIKHVYDIRGGLKSWEANQYVVFEDPSKIPQTAFTNAEYDSIIASQPLVLVDFYATWCGPCKLMEPHLLELEENYEQELLKVFQVDVDQNRGLSQRFTISSIPLTKIYKNGEEQHSLVGYQDGQFIDSLLYDLGLEKATVSAQ